MTINWCWGAAEAAEGEEVVGVVAGKTDQQMVERMTTVTGC